MGNIFRKILMVYFYLLENFDSVSAFLSGLISGIIMLQSFVIAPTVFNVFSETEARAFLRSIFPKFFLCIGLFSLISLCLSLITKLEGWITVLGAFSLAAATASYLLVPTLNRFRDTDETSMFKILHTFIVILTLAILIGNSLVIFLL